jgi:hypothetical protein
MNGKHTMRVALALCAMLAIGAAVGAQQPAPKKPGGAIGDLTAIDAAKGALTIKTTAGATTTAKVTAATEYLLIEPGKTSLEGAEKIALADVKLGDRVWARGEPGADGAIDARQLVVMSAQAIAERHTRDAREWQTRGLIGEVRALDAGLREITVESYRGEPVVVALGDATTLRRLKPGATDLSNAEPIGIEAIEVGNQIAVRGDRSADGARMTAETIVAGTFPRPVRGRVMAVDVAARAVTIVGRENRPVQLTLGESALVRKINPPPAAQGQQPPAGGAPAAAGGGRGPRGFAFALGDPAELERRTTAVELADVKPGDFVFAVVEPGATADAARVKVLVKAEIPADRPQRGAPSMQMPDMGFGDVP